MKKNFDLDPTLPSIVADLNGKYTKNRLTITIAFHPDTRLIGRSVNLDRARAKQHWVLGRGMPMFCDMTSNDGKSGAEPLSDQHISRAALRIHSSRNGVVLERESRACRCQINGRELEGEIRLDAASLVDGVVVFLAHRVVLVMRQTQSSDDMFEHPQIESALKGSSQYISSLKRQIQSVARSTADVLILGETGTGKELVATAIHANSARSKSSLVTVNMSAIPVDLAPAALFGSTKGAFTGADSAGVGYFDQAQNGTLFLDEVGDTPAEIQVQLLRALQEREIQPVGGRVRRIDVRVVAATDALVDEGSDFKAALRHRLGGSEICLQPLRKRREDIGELLWVFLQEFLHEANAEFVWPSPGGDDFVTARCADIFHAFVLFDWPGNVRQLANHAREISLVSNEFLVFPEALREKMCVSKRVNLPVEVAMRKSADVNEQEFLDTMAECLYEPKRAAASLCISRTAVYRRIDESSTLRIAGQLSQAEILTALEACGGDVKKAALALQVSSNGLRFRLRNSGSTGRKHG